MDTATHTHRRRIALLLVLAAAATTLGGQRSAPAREPLVIHGANAAEERAIDWSLRRYREAGLEGMPDLEVYVHRSHEGCRDGIGYYLAGRIDLCTAASSEPYQRKFALHEMAHGWIETNIDGAVLDRFMQVRGIAAWNDRTFDWKQRGTEQAAEIVTWGLGEGEISPLLPEALDAPALARLYELLTGREPITPAARWTASPGHDPARADDDAKVSEGLEPHQGIGTEDEQVGGPAGLERPRGHRNEHLLRRHPDRLVQQQRLADVDAGRDRPVPEIGPVDDRPPRRPEPHQVVARRSQVGRHVPEREDVEGRDDPHRPRGRRQEDVRQALGPGRVRELVHPGPDGAFGLAVPLDVRRHR